GGDFVLHALHLARGPGGFVRPGVTQDLLRRRRQLVERVLVHDHGRVHVGGRKGVAVFQQIVPGQAAAGTGGQRTVNHATVQRRRDVGGTEGQRHAAETSDELTLLHRRDPHLEALDV